MKRRKLNAFVLLSFIILLCSTAMASTVKMHIDIGLNHFHRNRFLEAFREFKAATEKDPRNPEAHFNLGRVYKAQGFLKEAMMQYQIALQLNPNYLSAQRELAELRQILTQDERVQQKLEGQTSLPQTDYSSIPSAEAERRGRQLLNQGRTNEAIRYFEVILRERPDDAEVLKLIAFLYFRQEKFADSLEYYTRAQKSSPQDAEIPYAIGLVHLKTNQANSAESSFQRALQLQPNMVKAAFALGESYEAQGKTEEAIFQFRKCLEMNPQLQEAEDKLTYLAGRQSFNYFSRGSYFYQQGDYAKAEPLLSLAQNYGNLSSEQNQQITEMLNASRFWLRRQQEQDAKTAARRQIQHDSYISRAVDINDVSRNPTPYIGHAVSWTGTLECIHNRRGKQTILLNSNSAVKIESNMDYAFEAHFSKPLPDDPRIGLGAQVEITGKIIRVERIFNNDSNTFSSRRQPVVDATEAKFLRPNYPQPLVLRFYD